MASIKGLAAINERISDFSEYVGQLLGSFELSRKLGLKRLDWLLIKSFIGPFVLTFFIALFVLIMQFLWKYIDDLVGKGLNTWILIELIFYASARLVPMALPLAVLLSSIMTFGALGEHMELTAAKSAGISLVRMMFPLVVLVGLISVGAFFFSNNLLPVANLKCATLIHDIQHQKPTVAIKEHIFYNEIDGFNLRVEKKDPDGNGLHQIIVYDHTSGQGADHIIMAEKGMLTQDEAAMSLTLTLENGNQFKDVKPKNPEEQKYEMYRTHFKSWEKKFDLSKFKLSRSDEGFFKDMKQMMTLSQLRQQLDTINMEKEQQLSSLRNYLQPYYGFRKTQLDSPKVHLKVSPEHFGSMEEVLKKYDRKERIAVMERAMMQARNVKNYSEIVDNQMGFKNTAWVAHMIEVYRKFTLSVACLVLFLIGAPLGSIIRKGGLGWPLFYAIVLFIVYHVSSIIGEKTSEKMVISVFSGMWLSTFILLPLGIWLTIKAAHDSKLFNADFYVIWFRRIFKGRRPVQTSK
ncbi:MAG: LptF/LptG family permease [Chitinophagales bacterium]